MDESALRCALQDLVNSLDVDAVLAALPPVTTTTDDATTAAAAATSDDAAGDADDSTMHDSDAAEQQGAGVDTTTATSNAAAAADSHDTRVEYIDDVATGDVVQATAADAEATDATIAGDGYEQ
jgi:hypothetical protein